MKALCVSIFIQIALSIALAIYAFSFIGGLILLADGESLFRCSVATISGYFGCVLILSIYVIKDSD